MAFLMFVERAGFGYLKFPNSAEMTCSPGFLILVFLGRLANDLDLILCISVGTEPGLDRIGTESGDCVPTSRRSSLSVIEYDG